MSTYEGDIREALKDDFESGDLSEVGESTAVFELLSKAYPLSGSKIDWAAVPDSIQQSLGSESESLHSDKCIEFFDEMCLRFKLIGPVLYVGDSATDFALKGSINSMKNALSILLEIPQHHYFVGPGASWCICMTMEGDMAFGLRPPQTL